MTIRAALQRASERVARRDAELLLGHLLKRDRPWMLGHIDEELSDSEHFQFQDMLKRRADAEPLQYIIGVQEFFGLPLQVRPGVLIPRPETEHLVETVLRWVKQNRQGSVRIVDVGTGSGAIAIALANEIPSAAITAVDLSDEALSIARKNADNLGLAHQIDFRQQDLLSTFRESTFDIVVSNPPYVPVADAATMHEEVVAYEPHSALFAGDDGLDVYCRLIPQARYVLNDGGLLAMEFGWGQSESLRSLLCDWDDITFERDYADILRVVRAIRSQR